MKNFIDNTAIIGNNVKFGFNIKIWDYSKIRNNVSIGNNVIIGSHTYIDESVSIGSNVKIQNYVSVYRGSNIGDGVFLGPGVIITNDRYPRAINIDGTLKNNNDWVCSGSDILYGASIGAHSVILPGLKIGKWATIGANSTIVMDIPDFALVVGSPCKQIGWVGRYGYKLISCKNNIWLCPNTKEKYIESYGTLSIKENK